MLRHKNIDRVCCIVLALTLLLSTLFVGAAAAGVIAEDTTIGYETRLFDQSRVHTIDIVMDDWDSFVSTATSEEYSSCHLVIDGESYKNVAIRGKGNTSLSSVQSYGNNRYSFKVEFDHYQTGATYHGLDKLSLNNLIQDNTYMKDYFAYTLMNKMGVAAPLCSFVQVNVNGEPWGLYLAVEGVEDAFLQRNYGKDYGELYKPDSMSFGGGRGNGRDFDMDDFTDMAEQFGFSFGGEDGEGMTFTMPEMPADGSMPSFPEGFDPSQMMGSFGGSFGESASPTAPTATAAPEPTPTPTAEMTDAGSSGASTGDTAAASSGMPAGGTMPGMNGAPQMPGGEMPAMPTDGTMPDMSGAPQMPGGEMPAMPTDGTMPGMNGAPQMPGGEMPAMPTGGTMPGMSGAPQMPGGEMSAMPTDGTRSDMGSMPADFDPSQMNRGGGFGGFGMGSEDVKLQYTDDDPSSYENIFNNAKTDITEADQNRLIASLKALGEGNTSVVDTEAVIRYMAVHNFLCNDDSYTGMMVHNYYLYEEDGVLSMIPWDYNLAYGTMTGGSNATSAVNTGIDTLVTSSSGDRPMADWIMASEEYTEQYRAIYQEFMATVFESGWFESEIDRVAAMISPYVESDPTAFCTYEEFQTGVQTLKSFCLKRAQSVANQLAGDDTRVDASELNLSDMGTMNGMGGGGPSFGGFDASERIGRGGRSKGSEVSDAPDAEATPDAEASPKPDRTASTENMPTVPDFTGAFAATAMSPANGNSSWIWLAVCAVLLAAAMVFAACFKANR